MKLSLNKLPFFVYIKYFLLSLFYKNDIMENYLMSLLACTLLWIAIDYGRTEESEIKLFSKDFIIVFVLMVLAITIFKNLR